MSYDISPNSSKLLFVPALLLLLFYHIYIGLHNFDLFPERIKTHLTPVPSAETIFLKGTKQL